MERDIHSRIEAVRRSMHDGHFRTSLKELDSAEKLCKRYPDLLSNEEYFRLTLLQRQCDLMARLLNESLEEIIEHGLSIGDEGEWQEKFSADYRGRTVVFDDVLRRDAKGRPKLYGYVVQAKGVIARVALEDIQLLSLLPLERPQRWLFGARLASCQREQGGVWVIRFDPESGVLVTDPRETFARILTPVDEELIEVCKRQKAWIGAVGWRIGSN
jgi:hypothetical protein